MQACRWPCSPPWYLRSLQSPPGVLWTPWHLKPLKKPKRWSHGNGCFAIGGRISESLIRSGCSAFFRMVTWQYIFLLEGSVPIKWALHKDIRLKDERVECLKQRWTLWFPWVFFDNFSKQVKRNEASRINEVIIRNSKTSIKFGVPRFLRICHLPAGQWVSQTVSWT